jgi:hypothetical protein
MKVVLSHMITDLMATHEKVPCLGQYNWQLKNQTNAIGAIHKGIYFQSVYLTAKSIQMFFIFGLSNSSYQNYQKIV